MILKNIRYMVLFILKFLASAMSLDNIKDCLNDQRGGLVLPISGNTLDDSEWLEYQKLIADCSVKPISPHDLPDEFCLEACRLVDEFRRKTVNEDVEWMLYFDYLTGEVIYCWKGVENRVIGVFEKNQLEGRCIASIHSHTKDYYSFPSGENFEILENDFEDYEIITSVSALWIIEFKGHVEHNDRYEFQYRINDEIREIMDNSLLMFPIAGDINRFRERLVSDYLLNEIDKIINNDKLILKKVLVNGE